MNKKGLGYPKRSGVIKTDFRIFSEKNMLAYAETKSLFCKVKEVFLTQKWSKAKRSVLLYLQGYDKTDIA